MARPPGSPVRVQTPLFRHKLRPAGDAFPTSPRSGSSHAAQPRLSGDVFRCVLAAVALLAPASPAQPSPAQAPKASAAASAQRSIHLVEQGHCREAIPVLKEVLPRLVGQQIRYHAGMALARCGMGLHDTETAVDALLLLRREFPDDPEVLYITTHYYSELGTRAAQELAARDPHSIQARRLNAEALESEGKYEEAKAVYDGILAENPHTAGIHYRLGQILLAEAGPTGSTDAAKAEFQQEAAIDPTNAATQFILGELARRAGDWGQAIDHFSQATKIDAGFAEAYLALGMSLASSGDYAGALPPLEKYVKMQPTDPAGHYQLAMAYSRTGNKQRAAQEIALQAKAASSAQPASDTTQGHTVPH